MMQQLVPQYVANRHRPPVGKSDLIVEYFIVDVVEARDGLLVNAPISRGELVDLTRAFEIRHVVVVVELPLGHPEAEACVDFGEVPGELTNRATLWVGTKIVLVGGQRFEDAKSAIGFGAPKAAKSVHLAETRHAQLQ